jgi:hypothetical protein
VTFPAFKAGDSTLRGPNGGFDFHTPPPYLRKHPQVSTNSSVVPSEKQRSGDWSFLHAQPGLNLATFANGLIEIKQRVAARRWAQFVVAAQS